MRKILVATLVAVPLAGFAIHAFAANGGAATAGSTAASPADLLPGPPAAAGQTGVHKRLSIKGIVIDDDSDGNEMDAGPESDD